MMWVMIKVKAEDYENEKLYINEFLNKDRNIVDFSRSKEWVYFKVRKKIVTFEQLRAKIYIEEVDY